VEYPVLALESGKPSPKIRTSGYSSVVDLGPVWIRAHLSQFRQFYESANWIRLESESSRGLSLSVVLFLVGRSLPVATRFRRLPLIKEPSFDLRQVFFAENTETATPVVVGASYARCEEIPSD
jgi:hypothetical protein